ncbi:MAG: DUF4386 domain-containing protein [Acidobacteriota bacterium]
MIHAKSTGRIIGLLLLVQLAGLIVPFVLLLPMTTTDFLANAAANTSQIRLALLLLLVNCALTIGISIVTYPVFREYNSAMALLLVVVSVIMFSLQAVDNVHLISMLSLSEQYVKAGGSEELFQTLSVVVRSTRRWAHYSELLIIDTWIFLLYSLLYRFRLVPRVLAGFGLITVLLHFTAIPLPLLLGYSSVTLLGVPMAFSHISLAIWLLAKGLDEGHYLLSAMAHALKQT